MQKSALAEKIEKIIAPTAQSMGYDIVRILMVGAGSSRPTLQIMAEKPDGTMHVDDCGRLSQAVSALLDVEDVIKEAYYLEVSSPGIDRPLTRLKDFDIYKDNDVRVEMDTAVDGQKKFKGFLRGVEGETIILDTETGTVRLDYNDVVKAKLVLTDTLIKKVRQENKLPEVQVETESEDIDFDLDTPDEDNDNDQDND